MGERQMAAFYKPLTELDLKPGDVVRNCTSDGLYDVLIVDEHTIKKYPQAHNCNIGDFVALNRLGVGYQRVKESVLHDWVVVSLAEKSTWATVKLNNFHESARGYEITYDLEDGIPVTDSIKMQLVDG